MKYLCNNCSNFAYYTDFYKSTDDLHPLAVYAYCPLCKVEAWGGLYFHPEMNIHFNRYFQPNVNATESDTWGKRVILQK